MLSACDSLKRASAGQVVLRTHRVNLDLPCAPISAIPAAGPSGSEESTAGPRPEHQRDLEDWQDTGSGDAGLQGLWRMEVAVGSDSTKLAGPGRPCGCRACGDHRALSSVAAARTPPCFAFACRKLGVAAAALVLWLIQHARLSRSVLSSREISTTTSWPFLGSTLICLAAFIGLRARGRRDSARR